MRKGKVSHWQIINKKLWKLILKNKNKILEDAFIHFSKLGSILPLPAIINFP